MTSRVEENIVWSMLEVKHNTSGLYQEGWVIETVSVTSVLKWAVRNSKQIAL